MKRSTNFGVNHFFSVAALEIESIGKVELARQPVSSECVIENPLWAELHISTDFPTSQECVATDPAHPLFTSYRVFAWNCFVLQALEQAGLRTPEVDPNFVPSGGRV